MGAASGVIFFGACSGLLVRELTAVPTALVPFQEQMEYYDYRPVNGVMLPFMVRFSNDAAYETSTRTFTSIREDVAVDERSELLAVCLWRIRTSSEQRAGKLRRGGSIDPPHAMP